MGGIVTHRKNARDPESQKEGSHGIDSTNESDSASDTEDCDEFCDEQIVEMMSTKRATKKSRQVSLGLLIAGSGGFAFGFFSPLFNIGVNDQFDWLPEGTVHLTGWTANFYFAVSFWFWAHVINVARMGTGPHKTDCNSYMKDNNKRSLAFATGLLCGLGNMLQFLGGMAAGFATCDMVQAFPLVGIGWGIMLFGEFRKAP